MMIFLNSEPVAAGDFPAYRSYQRFPSRRHLAGGGPSYATRGLEAPHGGFDADSELGLCENDHGHQRPIVPGGRVHGMLWNLPLRRQSDCVSDRFSVRHPSHIAAGGSTYCSNR